MIDFLLGVPGKLKTISDYLAAYLSPTRCAKIDNLDTTLTSRAPASTALSTATWTGTRAGFLDKIEGPAVAPPTGHSLPDDQITTTSSGNPPSVLALCAKSGDVSVSSYTTVLNVSGRGVLTFAALYFATSSGNGYMKIIVDGVTLIEQSTDNSQAFGALVGAIVVNASGVFAIPCEQIPFRTSLQIQIRNNGSGTVRAFWRYRLA